jgi:hypothetical protein
MGGKNPNLVTEIFPPGKITAGDNSANPGQNKNILANRGDDRQKFCPA